MPTGDPYCPVHGFILCRCSEKVTFSLPCWTLIDQDFQSFLRRLSILEGVTSLTGEDEIFLRDLIAAASSMMQRAEALLARDKPRRREELQRTYDALIAKARRGKPLTDDEERELTRAIELLQIGLTRSL